LEKSQVILMRCVNALIKICAFKKFTPFLEPDTEIELHGFDSETFCVLS
jgi:hypothetical protein